MMNAKKLLKLLGLMFVVIAGIFMIIATLFYLTTKSFLNTCNVAQGKVVDLVPVYKGIFFPVVSFMTEDGDTVKFRENVGSNPPRYKKGDLVRVLYDSEKPWRAKIDSFWSLWFISILFAFLGFTFGSTGTVLIIKSRSKTIRHVA